MTTLSELLRQCGLARYERVAAGALGASGRLRPLVLATFLAVVAPAFAEADNELYAAAAAGQVERVDSLLAQGADVNAKNPAERTALMAAAAAGNARVVRKLLAFGADPNTADKRGITALMEAAGNGYEEVARQLIAAGADVNAKDAAGVTLLGRVKTFGQGRIAALLEKSGAKETAGPNPGDAEAKTEGQGKAEDAKPADGK